MKKKFSKILGVGLTLALLASFLVTAAPVLADVSAADVTVDPTTISKVDAEYTIFFTIHEELAGLFSGTFTLPDTLDQIVITAAAATDEATLTTTAGAFTVTMSTGGTYTPATGVIAFAAATETATVEATVDNTAGTWAQTTGLPTAAIGNDVTQPPTVVAGGGAFSLPDATPAPGDDFVISDTSGAGTDVATITLPLTSGSISVVMSAGGNYNTTTGVITFVGIGETATVSATADNTAGIWAQTNGAPTAAPGGNVNQVVVLGSLAASGDTITVTFPEDTVLSAGVPTATIAASKGWIGTIYDDAVLNSTAWSHNEDDLTLTYTMEGGDKVGASAQVMINITLGITNPTEPGDYTLEVETSEEDDPVESEEYEIEVPDVDVLPGVVEVYNPSDVLMYSTHYVYKALDEAEEGWTIKIGEGVYPENPTTVNADVTIEGSGDIEDIIIEGTFTIDEEDITIDGITLDGDGLAYALVVTANDFTIQNCILEDATSALIRDAGSVADHPTIIDNCTFNIEDEIGVDANAVDAEITDCTFNVEEDGTGVGIDISADIGVTDCIFNGGSGVGIEVNVGSDAAIEGCTFDGLSTAFVINAGTADILGCTIQNCEDIAIDVDGATLVTIHNNTITGCNDAVILDVADTFADSVFVMFNTITDNAGDDDGLLINNNHTGTDLVVANNWWGDPDGPGDDAFSDDVVSEPFLPGPIENSAIETAVLVDTAADFEDVCGVIVESAGGGMAIVGAAQYTENPVAAIDDAVGFWDVAVIDPDATVTKITIRLYTDVTEDTEVWVWGAARGEWLEVSDYTPNLFAGFVGVVVTDITTPTVDDLEALPFVVVEPAAATEIDESPELLAPETGDDTVSLTPIFAWGAVAGADGYYFQLADNANFVTPMVKLDGDLGRLVVTAYAYVGELPYSTAYYWRVQAVSGTVAAGNLAASAWSTGVFITMDEPAEELPPVVVQEQPPVIIEPIVEVITPAATEITPAWIYVIIGVGGVLVIALLVLIVRTRRVA